MNYWATDDEEALKNVIKIPKNKEKSLILIKNQELPSKSIDTIINKPKKVVKLNDNENELINELNYLRKALEEEKIRLFMTLFLYITL